MAQHTHHEHNDEKDFSKNWVNSSRFLFYVTVLCFLAFAVGCSYRLYNQRWKGKPEVEVPESTQYNPKYK